MKKMENEEELNLFLQKNWNKTAIIKFSAQWCPPCHKLQENLSLLEIENINLAILEIDVDKFPQLVKNLHFEVSSLPTLFLFRPFETKIGLQSLVQLREWIKNKN